MPSRIVLISSGQTNKFYSTTKPSSTIEPSSVDMFRSGYTGYMAFVQYPFAFIYSCTEVTDVQMHKVDLLFECVLIRNGLAVRFTNDCGPHKHHVKFFMFYFFV